MIRFFPFKKMYLALVGVLMIFVLSSVSVNDFIPAVKGPSGWVIGDFHEHSHFSDGGLRLDTVFAYSSAHFGTHFMLNTDHGGAYPRNPDGKNWSQLNNIIFEGDTAGFDKNGQNQMWRWQELRDYSYPVVEAYRKANPRHHFIQGLEWNSPATSHSTVGILADNGTPIASFEYQFDGADRDVSGGPVADLVKMNGRKNGNGEKLSKDDRTRATAAAMQWLMKNHRYSSWTLIAHPERGGDVSVVDLRNINNAGKDVAFGFEGVPGHQKLSLRSAFFPKNALGGGTFGGVGLMVAKVGGIWDALLGEGRHFWLFTSSDFHGTKGDFWPGEYHKSWIHTKDTGSAQEILNGMRSGNVFVTNGDIINALQFTVNGDKKEATMGQTLTVNKGKELMITMRFHTPETNFNGQSPKVRMVQLIAGQVTGMIDPSSPAFSDSTNSTARVIKMFTEKDWTEKDGWVELKYKVEKPSGMYFRIRGTNHLPGTPFETDVNGSPLSDTLSHHLNIDGAEEAWADLWFYSNPIFINIK